MPLITGDTNTGGGQPKPTGGLIVKYKELNVREGQSPTETFGWDNSTAKRTFAVDWDERNLAVWQILGYPTAVQPVATTNIKRYLPEYHPTFPWLVATKITSVKGHGVYKSDQENLNAFSCVGQAHARQYEVVNGRKVARYHLAVIDVEYEIPDYPVLPDDQIKFEYQRFTSIKLKPNGDYLTLPVGFLNWAEGDNGPPAGLGGKGLPVPNSIGKIIPTMDIVFTWTQVPYESIPYTAIFACLGTVNHKTFMEVFPPHTLLLTAVDIKRLRTPYGTWAWEITYTLKYAPYVHNKLFDFNGKTALKRAFYPVTFEGVAYTTGGAGTPAGTANDGKYIFNERDFATLWNGTSP